MKRKTIIKMFGITEKQAHNKLVKLAKETGIWETWVFDISDVMNLSFENKINKIMELTKKKLTK